MISKLTIPEGYRPYGSTNNPEYLPALTTFCEQRGYRVHQKFIWACLRRLQNPSHTCTRCDKSTFPRPYDSLLDHFILLKAVDDSHWAYLGQPYFPERWLQTAAQELCWSGQCNSFEVIEPAPYGHNTTGILLIGNTKEQMWPKETKAIMRERIEALHWADIKKIGRFHEDIAPEQCFANKLFALTFSFVDGVKADASNAYLKHRSNELLTILIERRRLIQGLNCDWTRNAQVTR